MIQEDDRSKYLEEAVKWESLPPSSQAFFGTPQQYQQRIITYFYDHQKTYEKSLSPLSPQQYYEGLVQYGISSFLVFPYHLIFELQKFVPTTPFQYYTEMLLRVMQSDRSYQSIPNFSAADALRVTGVGRNQFIDAMNKSRAGGLGSILKSKEKIFRTLLPQVPKEFPLQSWWILYTVPAPENRLSKLSQSQKLTYERISSSGPSGVEVSKLSESDIRALISENLLYISIPLQPTDTVKILSLDNFVMNRVGGDYLEGLCYNSFISIDERTTVEQLSALLTVGTSDIAKVLSLFVRLGLAEKVTVDDHSETSSAEPASKRLVGIYDCNLPAALMMGNLGPKVKGFAVNLFEVGKIYDNTIGELVDALRTVEDPVDDSLAAWHEKCMVIARICEFLKDQNLGNHGLDLMQLESLHKLDADARAKMFERNYSAAVVLAPLILTYPSLDIPGLIHFGPPGPLFHSPWSLLYLHSACRGGPPVFVWPQGEIVTVLPEQFFEYDTVRLYKWGAEAVVVPTTTLLISLNDALPSSPVLVQCYEREGEKIEDRCFPGEGVDQELEKKFALGSLFGYVKYAVGEKSYPIDVLYGIPTVSMQLCNEVIEMIGKRGMFEQQSIEKMKSDSDEARKGIEEFVKQWSCGIGHPVKPLYAEGGNIQWI